ncbi:MAG: PaaI family thioesterase, partial [Candidatus Eremiobacteraeota bacterium]|nr:PaaI family thioesterase [Candidatus Eremiobacteraeota bacterium]
SAGEVEMHLPWRDEFGQYSGFLHAGVVGALLDTACGFAAATLSGANLLASQFSVRCLRPAVAKTFVVRGRVVKPGRQQIFAAADLEALENPGKLLAVCDTLLINLK